VANALDVVYTKGAVCVAIVALRGGSKGGTMKRSLFLVMAASILLFWLEYSDAAYRLHFPNGTTIKVESYEDLGESIRYERFGGAVTVPKTSISTIEDLGAPKPPTEADKEGLRIAALSQKFSKDLGPLVEKIETRADVLTVTVTDIWYSLKDFERERIIEYLRLAWTTESLKHGYPKGSYLVTIRDAWGKVLKREGGFIW
jgi:hypothetical protein